jgi:crotonobetainyl-CoA:carnitine CoA-transferase CaiB-like acyl-CoA transferase
MQRPSDQGGGKVAMVASPIRMSDTPVTYRHAPPVKGSSTEAILLDVLGKTAAEAQALRDQGVV